MSVDRLAECDLLPNQPGQILFLMKRFFLAVLFAGALSILSSSAQAPAQKDDQALLIKMVKEVQAQQLEIAANQTKVEAKLADIAESVRIARIYSSRSR